MCCSSSSIVFVCICVYLYVCVCKYMVFSSKGVTVMVRHDHVHVDLSIPRELWEVFKTEMSVGIPFTYKGLISEEAAEAFRNHIILKRKTRSNMQHPAQLHHSSELWTLQNKIIEYMKENGFWEKYGLLIDESTLKRAVHEIRDSTDDRVPKKWINRLLKYGLIEKSTLHRYKLNILDEERAGLTQVTTVPNIAAEAREKQADDILSSFKQGQPEESQKQKPFNQPVINNKTQTEV